MSVRTRIVLVLLALLCAPRARPGECLGERGGAGPAMTRKQVIEQTMKRYFGPATVGVSPRTLIGKVMCGYQGWFAAEGDGLGRGWSGWGRRGAFGPGKCGIDLWPDVSELDRDERYATAFRHADGRTAEVFSSANKKTVLRHFQWMRSYGIDGVFVQRFAAGLEAPKVLRHRTVVLGHCREGANRYGRAYAVMYDLSGLGRGRMRRVMDDWKLLIDRMAITKDKAYLHHNGRLVVAVWGLGFNDARKYTPAEGVELIGFLKTDPKYGRLTVVLGLPTGWRTLDRDCLADKTVHKLAAMGDVISPWTVGRYRNPGQAVLHARRDWAGDLAWCRKHGKDYLPVVFPGFSWQNLKPPSRLNDIPRLRGRFLWTQYLQARKVGASMVYQAMFDEVNEGTAIFKCTNDPPVGKSKFVTYEGLAGDYYLRLVGAGGRLIRREIRPTQDPPGLKE